MISWHWTAIPFAAALAGLMIQRARAVRQQDEIKSLRSELAKRETLETELRETLQAYRERRDILRTVLDGMNEGVAVADTNAKFRFVNPAMKRIFGIGLVDAPPSEWPSIYGAFDADSMEPLKEDELILVKATRGEGTESKAVFIRNPHRPEGVHIDASARPIHDEDGGVWGGALIMRDVTERKQFEAEREALIADLEFRNDELERFTYTVSHDLKAPLVTTKGFVGLLQRDLARGETELLGAYAERIATAANTMHALLTDVLELSRVGRVVNPPETIPLAALVEEATALVGGQIAIGGVELRVADDLPLVTGDRARLLEVLQNLIDNACKFMGQQPEPRIDIGCRERREGTVFFVRDNGQGIDPAYCEKVFGLFERLDTSVEGTGIGLALVKRIIETHGGKIWVESEGQDKGSTFLFTLPTGNASVDQESTG